MQLRGNVRIIPTVDDSIVQSSVHVRLLDVTRADASAETLAEVTLKDVSLTAGEPIDFVLDNVGSLDARNTYSLEAHVDIDGSGDVAMGDYRTMEHFDVSHDTAGEYHPLVCRRVD